MAGNISVTEFRFTRTKLLRPKPPRGGSMHVRSQPYITGRLLFTRWWTLILTARVRTSECRPCAMASSYDTVSTAEATTAPFV